MLDTTPTAKLARLLDAFDAALAAGDIGRAVDQFEEDCYWRDLVAFTWNIKTIEGRDEIRGDAREPVAASVAPTGFAPAEGEEATEADGLIEGWIRFETGVGARLWPYPAQGRQDLDTAHHHGRAEGP